MTSNWHLKRIKEFAEFNYGKNLPANKRVEGPYPVYGSSSVTSYHDTYLVKGPGIIIGRKGTVGKVQLSKENFFPIDTTFYVDKNSTSEDILFLYYFFQLCGFSQMNSDAAVPGLNRNAAINLRVRIPSLPSQQKIAHILSSYDDLIENNLKRIKLLEEQAQITYEQWFVRMKFPGHESTPIDAKSGLPEGWKECAISDLSLVNADSITKKNAPDTIKYIDIKSANTGSYELPKIMKFETAPSRARRKVNFGDIIFSTVRPNRKIYSLILEHDSSLVASTGFATLTSKIPDTYSFIYLSVANQSFIDRAVAVAGGAAYPAVNQTDFEKLTITFPGDELIRKFSELYNPYFDLVGNLKRQNIHLKEARDILLPRLMTGMIDVDHIELPINEEEKETA